MIVYKTEPKWYSCPQQLMENVHDSSSEIRLFFSKIRTVIKEEDLNQLRSLIYTPCRTEEHVNMFELWLFYVKHRCDRQSLNAEKKDIDKILKEIFLIKEEAFQELLISPLILRIFGYSVVGSRIWCLGFKSENDYSNTKLKDLVNHSGILTSGADACDIAARIYLAQYLMVYAFDLTRAIKTTVKLLDSKSMKKFPKNSKRLAKRVSLKLEALLRGHSKYGHWFRRHLLAATNR